MTYLDKLNNQIEIFRSKLTIILEAKNYCLIDVEIQKAGKLLDELVCEYHIYSYKNEMDLLIEEYNFNLSHQKIIHLSQFIDKLLSEYYFLKKFNKNSEKSICA